jgi:hypothetical protein
LFLTFGTGAAAIAVSRAEEAGQLPHSEQCKAASKYRLHSLFFNPVSLIVKDCELINTSNEHKIFVI